MKIAAAQIECEVGNIKSNLKTSLEWIERAAADGADLICFPESVLDGYACKRGDLIDLSRAIDDREIHDIQSAARRSEIWVMWSFAERAITKVANTAILINRGGVIAMTYRKTHLCAEFNETVAYAPGNTFDVVPMEGVNVGVMICFDRHFPEWFSSSSMRNSINTAMMRTRAYENRCFVLSVNRANDGGAARCSGLAVK